MTEAPQKTAIVTGAAAGIGRATVERLLADEWRVVGIDRNAASIDGAEMLVGDAGDEPMLAAALKICGGSLDALVCSAGIPPSGPWESREHWDEVIAVDLAAPYEALRVCMPALVAARGSAVLVGSIVGAVEGSLRSPAYAAAKAGLEGLARSMAVIGAPDGVRVNVVAPGRDRHRLRRAAAPRRPSRRTCRSAGWEPRTRWPPSSASCIGPDASYVTGAVWTVDGGRIVLVGRRREFA